MWTSDDNGKRISRHLLNQSNNFISSVSCHPFASLVELSKEVFSSQQEATHGQLQQESNENKQDDANSQNMQGTQELLITLQVPPGLQHVQPQLLSEPTFALQHVQLVPSGQETQTVRWTLSLIYGVGFIWLCLRESPNMPRIAANFKKRHLAHGLNFNSACYEEYKH